MLNNDFHFDPPKQTNAILASTKYPYQQQPYRLSMPRPATSGRIIQDKEKAGSWNDATAAQEITSQHYQIWVCFCIFIHKNDNDSATQLKP